MNEALKRASASDLKRFNNLLKRMNTQNDNLFFSVDSFATKFNEYYKGLYITLEQFNEKLSKKTSFTIEKDITEFDEDFSNYVFVNVIKKINEKLEIIYPDRKMTKAERNNYLAKIYKLLSD